MSTDRLASLLAEYEELEARLADPSIHADQAAARRVGRRFAQLTPIHKTAGELAALRADVSAAKELAQADPEFAVEAAALEEQLPALEERLAELLAPHLALEHLLGPLEASGDLALGQRDNGVVGEAVQVRVLKRVEEQPVEARQLPEAADERRRMHLRPVPRHRTWEVDRVDRPRSRPRRVELEAAVSGC